MPAADKVQRQTEGTFGQIPGVLSDLSGMAYRGYEIHMGETCMQEGADARPLVTFDDGHTDGCAVGNRCMGTYIHGILDNDAFVDFLLEPYADRLVVKELDYQAYKEEQYNKLADHVRKHLNIPLLYRIMQGE